MAFNTGLSGLTAASNNLDVIGNNIANASTNGFKSSRAEFADVYAASGLGTGSNAIGSGVLLASVSQQFSQGTIEFTENSLDLAVNGSGFFVVSNNGTIAYTRSGAYGVDKDGFISDPNDNHLYGFLADSTGNITGAQGDLQIARGNLAPLASDTISMQLNLNASATPPLTVFSSGFTPTNPPDPTSYTSTTSTTIYDSLGNSHILTTYFVKQPQPNQWRVYSGVDGSDVTPTASATPGGAPPQPYGVGAIPAPFTLVFSDTGAFIPNDPAVAPQYYGPTPVLDTVGAMSTAGSLPTLVDNDLTINGVQIEAAAAVTDVFSTSDKAGSAIAITAAINASRTLHGVTATAVPAVFDAGNFTTSASPTTLAANNLTINGTSITGVISLATPVADLVGLINAQSALSGVSASNPSGTDIVLTAVDGRNIEIQTDGAAANNAAFANFSLSGGAALDEVQRGQVSLSIPQNEAIVIGGNAPAKIGFGAGAIAGIIYANSDVISITGWNPGTGAASPQAFSLDLSASTQYGAPFSVQALSQDGYSTGRLASVDVDSAGIIIARYSNGQSLQLGQVVLADFGNEQGLQAIGNSQWAETFNSGPALVGAPGTSNLGVIQSGALEDSNVDLTDSLVSLITAQRDFQANAQSIKTDDAITQTIINIR